jgi:hypothetical protein
MNDPRRWGAEPPGSNSIPSLGGGTPWIKLKCISRIHLNNSVPDTHSTDDNAFDQTYYYRQWNPFLQAGQYDTRRSISN